AVPWSPAVALGDAAKDTGTTGKAAANQNQAAGNAAEDLYRAFEKKLQDAKAFRVTFAFELNHPKSALSVNGDVVVAAGNKLKASLRGRERGQERSVLVVADGKTHAVQWSDGSAVGRPTSAKLEAFAREVLAKAGAFAALEKDGPVLNPDAPPPPFTVTPRAFTPAAKEKLGDRDGHVVAFTL